MVLMCPGLPYLSLLVCAIGRVLQCSLQGLFRLARSHQLLDLAGKRLDIFRRHGLDGGGKGREVEVVRGFRVEGVDVECSPVEVGHFGCAVVREQLEGIVRVATLSKFSQSTFRE
jgi:hypothetical protein